MRSKLRSLRDRYEQEGVAGAVSAVATFLRGVPPEARRRLKARRVNRWKQQRDASDLRYEHEPRVSFLVQWFNQRNNVENIAPRLPDEPACETVICEDGSVDGSLKAWDERLTRRNDFVIRSNDLHEIRTYTRAIGLACGDVVCLLQDDDTLPESTDWVDDALALFDANPDMAVLCGQSAWNVRDIDPDYEFDPPSANCVPGIEEWLRGSGGFRDELPEDVPTRDPETGQRFVFAPCISVGPVFVRTSVFEELGGFDLGFADPGEPGMGFEVDFSLRCWKAGYRVGFTPMGFDRGAVGGTKTFAQQDRSDAREEAWERLRNKHRAAFDTISERVWRANAELAAADEE